jgi:hypothetical protein
MASVVIMRPATDAASCRAIRTTFAGRRCRRSACRHIARSVRRSRRCETCSPEPCRRRSNPTIFKLVFEFDLLGDRRNFSPGVRLGVSSFTSVPDHLPNHGLNIMSAKDVRNEGGRYPAALANRLPRGVCEEPLDCQIERRSAIVNLRRSRQRWKWRTMNSNSQER